MGVLKYLPALQLVVANNGGQLRDLTSTCAYGENAGKSSISFNYHPSDFQFNKNSFAAGECVYEEVDYLPGEKIDIDGKEFIKVTIEYDAKKCTSEVGAVEGSISSYDSSTEFRFSTGLGEEDGVFLNLRGHIIPAKCTFQDSYVVEYNFGQIQAVDEGEPKGTESGVTFRMDAYSDSDRTSKTDSDVSAAGDMTYVTISPDRDLPKGLSYAPVECKLVETAADCTENCELNSFTLFNPPAKSCASSTEMVKFNMLYNNADSTWDFEFMLFVFDQFNLNNYNLVCNINVCHTSGNPTDTCNAVAKSCLSNPENFFKECQYSENLNLETNICECISPEYIKDEQSGQCICALGFAGFGGKSYCSACPEGMQSAAGASECSKDTCDFFVKETCSSACTSGQCCPSCAGCIALSNARFTERQENESEGPPAKSYYETLNEVIYDYSGPEHAIDGVKFEKDGRTQINRVCFGDNEGYGTTYRLAISGPSPGANTGPQDFFVDVTTPQAIANVAIYPREETPDYYGIMKVQLVESDGSLHTCTADDEYTGEKVKSMGNTMLTWTCDGIVAAKIRVSNGNQLIEMREIEAFGPSLFG